MATNFISLEMIISNDVLEWEISRLEEKISEAKVVGDIGDI